METIEERQGRLNVTPRNGMAAPLEYHIEEDVEENFTRRKAYEFLELKTFKGERDVRETHVQMLLNEYMSNRFVWHHVLLAKAILNGEVYRINGQHTAWMRIYVPEEGEPGKIPVRIVTYKVQTEEQLRGLYSVFDRNAPRTTSHIVKMSLVNTNAAEGIPTGYINFVAAGFRMWHWENPLPMRNNPAELAAVIEDNFASLFNLVASFFKKHYAEATFVKRAAVVGAMFATFDKAPQMAGQFWEPVLNGLNLNQKTDPRYALRRFLEEHGHTIGHNKTPITQEEQYRVAINAWNKWRKGDTVQGGLRGTERRMKAA